jgi:hypothetical protein
MAIENNRMKNLENIFAHAKEKDHYVAIVVEMAGFPRKEIIINHPDNIDSKLEYYKKTYDKDLNHKYADGIKITGVAVGASFDKIHRRVEEEL